MSSLKMASGCRVEFIYDISEVRSIHAISANGTNHGSNGSNGPKTTQVYMEQWSESLVYGGSKIFSYDAAFLEVERGYPVMHSRH